MVSCVTGASDAFTIRTKSLYKENEMDKETLTNLVWKCVYVVRPCIFIYNISHLDLTN